ncbi:uncharacterized protein LOC131945884 [Physella acuta]|uniref:uncharacterized protein LOC131945884 n=1 Tax=Physella acuta TaxID=109671 RepID=UPI0027DCC446|nr:uncharacterized protein LOC131945884 [Physella acuta]
MFLSPKVLTPWLVVLGVLGLAENKEVVQMSMHKEINVPVGDSGQGVNCGKNPVNLTWTPKDLSPSGEVTVSLYFTPPYEMATGSFDARLFEAGSQVPKFEYGDQFDCGLAKQYGIPCPLKKGVPFAMTKTITKLSFLSGHAGLYIGIIQLFDDQDVEMFCVNMTARVLTS